VPGSRPEMQRLLSGETHHIPWGWFIEGEDEFDHEAFGISAMEAVKMDPQQRMLLETAWAAIEDSGSAPSEWRGSSTGVFVGISTNDYARLMDQAGVSADVFSATGNAHSIAANRLSYLFNLKGLSLSVDTACSSSLVAAHLAAQ